MYRMVRDNDVSPSDSVAGLIIFMLGVIVGAALALPYAIVVFGLQ